MLSPCITATQMLLLFFSCLFATQSLPGRLQNFDIHNAHNYNDNKKGTSRTIRRLNNPDKQFTMLGCILRMVTACPLLN